MSAEAPTPRAKRRSLFARAAREPLLQFLAAAIVLFAADRLLHGPQLRTSSQSISIEKGRVRQIADSFRLLSGRLPSRAELEALVDDFIDEEVDYREAIAMGLDADDTIVRRRMRQKLEFLAEDAEASEEPSETQLTEWLASHRSEYRFAPRIAFRHVLASNDLRGNGASTDAQAFLDELHRATGPSKPDLSHMGDPSMLPQALPLTTERGVAQLFGESFASRVFAHEKDGWFGPVESPLGAHAVLILSREPARDPTLGDVRDKLRSDWIEARRRARRDEFQARLRERYEVSIDWPEPYASQPTAAAAARLQRPLDTLSGE